MTPEAAYGPCPGAVARGYAGCLQTPSRNPLAGPSFKLTKPWNNNSFPALSVPVGLDGRGLPVGLQLAGLPLTEARLLTLGIALDEDVRFFTRRPPMVESAG